jgi:predicted esterase
MILVTAGSNDTVVYDSPAKYDKLLTKNGVNHMFQTIPGGAHGANSVEPHFYNLLRMLFRTSW